MSRNEGKMHKLAGVRHDGTTAFGKRVLKNRKKAKASKKARKRNRK